MRTVQMTLDEDLVATVDRITRQLRTTRSEFTRMALREAIAKQTAARLEELHRKGDEKRPVGRDEFEIWEGEHAWVDE
ncbi:MAG: ribbon-helix-helix protein, CopG family [Acidobacteria bacterium]|nr:ribbon-helix-helix protein, CopG family [Acidobacteriota bacterium]